MYTSHVSTHADTPSADSPRIPGPPRNQISTTGQRAAVWESIRVRVVPVIRLNKQNMSTKQNTEILLA